MLFVASMMNTEFVSTSVKYDSFSCMCVRLSQYMLAVMICVRLPYLLHIVIPSSYSWISALPILLALCTTKSFNRINVILSSNPRYTDILYLIIDNLVLMMTSLLMADNIPKHPVLELSTTLIYAIITGYSLRKSRFYTSYLNDTNDAYLTGFKIICTVMALHLIY
jgi:hypothetical protein